MTTSEELWLDIFETMVRGGRLPDSARDLVALGSGRGTEFANSVRERWATQLDEFYRAAIKSAE